MTSTAVQEARGPSYLPLATALEGFLTESEHRGAIVHRMIVHHRGQRVYDYVRSPSDYDAKYLLFSATKAITATAVGAAIGDGMLSLSTTLGEVLPDLPGSPDERPSTITVEDLLTMRSGRLEPLNGPTLRSANRSWAELFLAGSFTDAPVAPFKYCAGTAHMLSVLISHATGQSLEQYTKDRLFDALGITDYLWESDPSGCTSGAGGLWLKTEDYLKWGLVHLADGLYQGERILPPGWTDLVGTAHVPSIGVPVPRPIVFNHRFPPPYEEFERAFGYQSWICSPGTFLAKGAYGQLCIVSKELDTVIALNGSIDAGLTRIWPGMLLQVARNELSGHHGVTPDMEVSADVTDEDGEVSHVELLVDTSEASLSVSQARGVESVVAGFGGPRSSRQTVPAMPDHDGYRIDKLVASSTAEWVAGGELRLLTSWSGVPYQTELQLDLTNPGRLKLVRVTRIGGRVARVTELSGPCTVSLGA